MSNDKDYVLARNADGRATLCHRTTARDRQRTLCGTDISRWSRVFVARPIPILLCRRCKKQGA